VKQDAIFRFMIRELRTGTEEGMAERGKRRSLIERYIAFFYNAHPQHAGVFPSGKTSDALKYELRFRYMLCYFGRALLNSWQIRLIHFSYESKSDMKHVFLHDAKAFWRKAACHSLLRDSDPRLHLRRHFNSEKKSQGFNRMSFR